MYFLDLFFFTDCYPMIATLWEPRAVRIAKLTKQLILVNIEFFYLVSLIHDFEWLKKCGEYIKIGGGGMLVVCMPGEKKCQKKCSTERVYIII